MENSEGRHQNHSETPKRQRSSDEEISPSIRQEEKVRKMRVDEQAFNELKEMVRGMATKLDKLDALVDDITAMKESQRETYESVKNAESKIVTLESEMEILRDDNKMLGEKVSLLEKKEFVNGQARLNDTLMIRNLPKEVCKDRALMFNVVEKIFDTIGMNLSGTSYKATAFSTAKMKSATVELKLASSVMKEESIHKFRELKNNKANYNGELLIEKFCQLPAESQLNGKTVMLSSKLHQHYLDLVQDARKYVGTHFDFVLEAPDSRILVRRDGFHHIDSKEDLKRLVEKFDKIRLKKKPKQQQSQPASSIRTRSQN
jgi:hypothetical protein